MKRIIIILLFTGMSLTALLFGISCSNQTPNTALETPLKGISGINPTLTATYTMTFTTTPTPTPPFPVTGFNGPFGLAIDSKNNVYVGDTGNNLIKQYVNGFLNTSWPAGKAKSSNGLPYTSPKAIAVDGAGNLYVVGNGNAVSKFDPNGNFLVQYTTTSPAMSGPLGVAVQGTTIYVSDTGNNRILSITPTGVFSVFVGAVTYVPYGLIFDTLGNLYVAGNDNVIHIYTSTGAVPTSPAPSSIIGFNSPYAVALDSHNDLFVSDTGNKQIEEIAPTNNYANSPSNFIGAGTLSSPEGIALDSSGNVYVVDSGNNELFQFP